MRAAREKQNRRRVESRFDFLIGRCFESSTCVNRNLSFLVFRNANGSRSHDTGPPYRALAHPSPLPLMADRRHVDGGADQAACSPSPWAPHRRHTRGPSCGSLPMLLGAVRALPACVMTTTLCALRGVFARNTQFRGSAGARCRWKLTNRRRKYGGEGCCHGGTAVSEFASPSSPS